MAAKDSTRGTLSANELSAFCAQLALITKAGIPAQEGISIMMEDAGDVRTRELMQSVLNKLEEGAPLHKALAQTGRFPKYMLDRWESASGPAGWMKCWIPCPLIMNAAR